VRSVVALRDDLLVVGAPFVDRDDNIYPYYVENGVHVFSRSRGAWTLIRALVPPGGQGAFSMLGASLSLSEDYLLIGTPDNHDPGRAFLYFRAGTGLIRISRLPAGPELGRMSIGSAVELAGEQVLVGQPLPAGSFFSIDLLAQRDTAEVTLVIDPTSPDPPDLEIRRDNKWRTGQQVELELSWSDPDTAQTPVIEIVSKPDGMSFAGGGGSGTLVWTPESGDTGTDTIVVAVNSGDDRITKEKTIEIFDAPASSRRTFPPRHCDDIECPEY